MTKYSLILFLLNFGFYAWGQSVSMDNARAVAKNHTLIFDADAALKSAEEILFEEELVLVEGADSLFYVFNRANNKGFVIIAADERAFPVLGFAPSGRFSTDNQPPSFSSFMQSRKEQMQRVKLKETPPAPDVSSHWQMLKSTPVRDKSEVTGIEPMMPVTWNQGCGYNSHCPEDPAGPCGHAYAGCVATAMGQIMKYWEYPSTGRGSHSYYSPYGELEVDFSQQHYDWEAMPTDAPSDEVAELLYHVGVAVEMNYTAEESGAASYMVRHALTNYFRYSFRAQHYSLRHTPREEVIEKILIDLNDGKVLYYAGCPDVITTSNPCHAFVIDGYMSYAGYYIFHFNFGWGGSHNGYFYLQDLAGGSGSYNNPSGLISNIHPADCQVFELPFEEDFETGSADCWQSFNKGSRAFNWEESLVQNRTPGGNASAMHSNWSMSEHPEESYLISPAIQLPADPGPGISLSFWSKNFCPDLYYNGKNSLLISTNNGETFTQLWEADYVENEWVKNSVNLNDYAGQKIRIAFMYEKYDEPNAHTWFLDDIRVALDEPEPPEVVTVSVFDISEQSARAIGRVSYQGDSPVSARGMVWSTSAEPTLENHIGMAQQGEGQGAFQVELSGLTHQTTYYLRAWATNEQGTSYGNSLRFMVEHTPFVCGESTVTDVEGNIYSTVQIGNQCWMGENLKTTSYRNGVPVNNPNCVVNFMNTEWGHDTEGAYIAWNNSEAYRQSYGAIYNFYAVENENKLCPPHWHIPADAEWRQLEFSLGISPSMAGVMDFRGENQGSMLADGGSYWADGVLKEDDAFGITGFNALPNGWYPVTTFGSGTSWPDKEVAWWSTSTHFGGNILTRRLAHDQTGIERLAAMRSQGLYVRCARNLPTLRTMNPSDVNKSQARTGGWLNIHFDDEGAQVLEKGLLWGTEPDLSLENYENKEDFGEGAENFYFTLENLQPATAYYVRAFARNSLNLVYGEELKLHTLGEVKPCPGEPTVTDSEGNTYNTVWIGDQCWLADNMRVTQNLEGTPIERICPEGNEELCTTLGGLYRWETIMDGQLYEPGQETPVQGICPTDWYLPDNAQWDALRDYLIGHGYNYNHTLENNLIAESMAAGHSWLSIGMMPTGSPGDSPAKNNSSGFSAIPAGGQNADGNWIELGRSANFWSITLHPEDENKAGYRSLSFRDRDLAGDYISKEAALSVRCVKKTVTTSAWQPPYVANRARIYPNPAKEEVVIELFSDTQKAVFEIYDLQGRRLLVKNFAPAHKQMKINLQTLPDGMYILKIFTGQYTESHRIVKYGGKGE